MRRACFACTTPYQIMGAVSIVTAEGMTADLIVFGMFDGYEDLASRIREAGIFSDVIAVPPGKFQSPGQIGALGQMVRCGAVVASFLPADRQYERCFLSSRAHIKNLLLHELLRRNPRMGIVIYDDGMGTYDGRSHVLNTSAMRVRAEKLLGWNIYDPERIEYLVYEPALFTRPARYGTCPVRQMPKPGERKETMELIARIFHVTPEDQIRERVIIFDPFRGLDSERAQKFPAIDRCYREAVSVFGRDNVIIKPHPRSTEKPDADAKIYTRSGIPMEALYAGMEDLQDRILITYASTAVYTPRILFAKEPWVIALFRITDGETGSEWQPQFDKFRQAYSAPERMAAPVSAEEFTWLIRGIRDPAQNA